MATLFGIFKIVLLTCLPFLLVGIYLLLDTLWQLTLFHNLLFLAFAALFTISPFLVYTMRIISSIALMFLRAGFVTQDPKSFLEDHIYHGKPICTWFLWSFPHITNFLKSLFGYWCCNFQLTYMPCFFSFCILPFI